MVLRACLRPTNQQKKDHTDIVLSVVSNLEKMCFVEEDKPEVCTNAMLFYVGNW